MSKNNMLLGYARGKVGSLVFSRLKGQQITKAHNANPANPKTYNQMMQRVLLAVGVAVYKMAQSKFFKFAFEDKKVTESDYNAFIRKNIALFPYLEKAAVKDNQIPVQEFVVSSGSLGAFPCNITTPATGTGAPTTGFAFLASEVSSLFAELPNSNPTVKAISDKIIANSGGRLQYGDLLTLIAFRNTDDVTEQTTFNYVQFKLADNNTTVIGADNNPFFKVGVIGEAGTSVYVQTGFLASVVAADDALAIGLIITRKEGSQILASDSKLAPNSAMTSDWSLKRTESAKLAAARSYGATQSAILNPQKY